MICDFSCSTNAIWDRNRAYHRASPRPGACLAHEIPGTLHVGRDLLGQLLRRVELHLVSEAGPELDGHILPQERAFEIEQVRLHVHGLPAERGVRAHVDGGDVVALARPRPARVDALPGKPQAMVGLEVRGGPAEVVAPARA